MSDTAIVLNLLKEVCLEQDWEIKSEAVDVGLIHLDLKYYATPFAYHSVPIRVPFRIRWNGRVEHIATMIYITVGVNQPHQWQERSVNLTDPASKELLVTTVNSLIYQFFIRENE
jgi:hypothetical protein